MFEHENERDDLADEEIAAEIDENRDDDNGGDDADEDGPQPWAKFSTGRDPDE